MDPIQAEPQFWLLLMTAGLKPEFPQALKESSAGGDSDHNSVFIITERHSFLAERS